ncbi:MAG TPA: Isoniazid-inducible protein iniC, partial [Jatrophihabitantaceae bacterium]
AAPDATTLARLLSERSGLDRLRDVLAKQFLHRSQLLKARSALSGLQEVLRADGCTGAASLQAHIEQVVTGTHAFEELRLLTALRGDDMGLDSDRLHELDRVLGGSGHDARSRLGLPPDADQDAVRDAALTSLQHWQRVGAHPLSNRSLQLAARGACRTLEGIVADQISPSRST